MFKKEVVEGALKRTVTRFRDMKLDEQTWRKAERNQANRERRRLIENGLIVPFYRLGPSMLTKSDTSKTGWKASA